MIAEERCKHGNMKSWMPCSFCHPAELGAPSTPEQKAAVALKGAAMRTGPHSFEVTNSRALNLEGQTLAGCYVLRRAADATHASRFLCKMSCGHEEVVTGSDLKMEAKAGKTVSCKACAKAARRKRSRAHG